MIGTSLKSGEFWYRLVFECTAIQLNLLQHYVGIALHRSALLSIVIVLLSIVIALLSIVIALLRIVLAWLSIAFALHSIALALLAMHTA